MNAQPREALVITCEMFIGPPLDPDDTMHLKLLKLESDFWASFPVFSRASFRILLTSFSNDWRIVLPGVA